MSGRTRMECGGKTKFAFLLVGAALFIVCSAEITRSKDECNGAEVWSVSEGWFANASLEDVRADGLLLISELDGVYRSSGASENPKLSLRSIKDGKLLKEIPLGDWRDFFRLHPSAVYQGSLGPFRFLRHSDSILGLQSPWLVLIDIRSGKEVRRVQPADDLTDPNLGLWDYPFGGSRFSVAVNPEDDSVAASFNFGSQPRIFIYNKDLTKLLRTWPRQRYIQDICWSPDGKSVAVLYSGKYDQNRGYVGGTPKRLPVRLPDVEIVDARTGSTSVNFFTGGAEAKLAFSPDGSLLYTVSTMRDLGYRPGDLGREVMRAFSPKTGGLLRTLRASGTGLRFQFSFSPDGRYIAANASTPISHFHMFSEGDSAGDNASVVVLDAATGKAMFTCRRQTRLSYGLDPMFSPDGRELIVMFGPRPGSPDLVDVVALSLTGLYGP